MNKFIILTILLLLQVPLLSQNFKKVPTVNLNGAYLGSASWGDYNSDGLLDIFITGSDFDTFYRYAEIYTNNGDRTFSKSKIDKLPKVIYGDIAWGDYDNNGTLDLIYAGTRSGFSEDNITQIYKNLGASNFISINHPLPKLAECYLEWVDIDNDGLLDIYCQGINSNKEFELGIYKNYGSDQFQKVECNIESITGPRGNFNKNTGKWADFDNDGLKDVILALSSKDNFDFVFYKNKGNFQFEKIDIELPKLNYVSMDIGDINQDGLMDIVFAGSTKSYLASMDYSSYLYVMHNKGNLTFEESQRIYGADVFINTLELGDINNDGYPDIIYYGTGSNLNKLRIYTNNKDNTFKQMSHNIENSCHGGASLGDFDNDNDLDILYYGRVINPSNGWEEEATYIYENKSEVTNTAPEAPKNIKLLAVGNDLQISWTEGMDDSTLPSSLNYNISIGTTENPNSIISSNSINGSLLFPHRGNLAQTKSYLHKNFPEGNFRIRLQTIDQAFNASEYSAPTEICFKKTSNLWGDTLHFCSGDSLLLEIDGDHLAYNWNTGSTKAKVYLKNEGLYNVNITHTDGCISSETVYLKENDSPEIDLGKDRYKCPDQEVELLVPIYNQILWSNASTQRSIKVTKPGEYWVQAIAENGCSNRDTIWVKNRSVPKIDLGPDTIGCSAEGIELEAQGYFSTVWSNSSTENTIRVFDEGEYWVQVIGYNSCINRDTIRVSFKPSPALDLGADIQKCLGESVHLQATGYPQTLWSNQSTAEAITITKPGDYWVKVTGENGCPNTDTIKVTFTNSPYINLGTDIVRCSAEPVMLEARGYTQTLWNNQTTEETISIKKDGIYWVQVKDENGCSNSDTIQVIFNQSPEINLGTDLQQCVGDTVELEAYGYSQTLWSNQSTEETLKIFQPGEYWVLVTGENGCSNSDTIQLTFNSLPNIDLGVDIEKCPGDTVVLEAYGYNRTLWSNQSSQATISINQAGNHWVEVMDENGCINRDTVLITLKPLPEIDLGPDQVKCEGDTVVLKASGYTQTLWSKDSEEEALSVTQSGNYWVKVTSDKGCTNIDTISIHFNPLPSIDLGPDLLKCQGETVELEATGYTQTLWNNESTEEKVSISEAGDYWVQVTGDDNCVNRDTISILFNPTPEIDLGENIMLDLRDSVKLVASIEDGSYLWSTGSQNGELLIRGQEKGIGAHVVWVEVSNEYGCITTDTITIEVENILGIQDIGQSQKLRIFPNPFNDYITIQNETRLRGKTVIKLMDLQGKLIYQNSLQPHEESKTLSLPHISKGTYILLIQNGENNLKHSFKIMK